MNVEQEPKSIEGGVPPAYWPSSGEIRAENLSARYSPVRLLNLVKYSGGPETMYDSDWPKGFA
jgi:hypothetical protein